MMEEETPSLHNYIRYNIKSSKKIQEHIKWKKEIFSCSRFKASVRQNSNILERAEDVNSFMRALNKIQTDAMRKVRVVNQSNDVYWWSEEIETLRADTLTAKRTYGRARRNRHRNPEDIEELRETYKERRRNLKKGINKNKTESWRKLCEDLEDDVWGEGFKIVMRSLKQKYPRLEIARERRVEIANTLFPEEEVIIWENIGEEEPPLDDFTLTELANAADRLKSNRAPGPDGILPEAVKMVVKENGNIVLTILNDLLKAGKFPKIWKRAKLILAPKPGRDLNEANGFRPICLLDTAGKLYEAHTA